MDANRRFSRCMMIVVAAVSVATTADADDGLYRIQELFSSAAGTLSDGTTTNSFTFLATSHDSNRPRTEYVLIIAQSLSQSTNDPSVWVIQWDYVVADVQARFPKLILETDTAFYAGLPDRFSGTCARGTHPVYRLWNPACNDHWFAADDNARARALGHGYVPEGYSAKGVAMCAILACYTG